MSPSRLPPTPSKIQRKSELRHRRKGGGKTRAAREWIGRFGKRAFRRPLSTAETNDYVTLYKDKLRAELGLGFADAIRVLTQALAFAHWAVLQDGNAASLLSSRVSFINEPLAQLYGVNDVSGMAMRQVELDRPGILTRAGPLTLEANEFDPSPIHRGKFVREHLLCQTVGAPPPNIPDLAPPAPNVTNRERYAQHSADASCSACHRLMDPIGFDLESFDAIGRSRAMDAGRPVDSTGTVVEMDKADHPFSGPTELATLLSTSAQVRACLARSGFASPCSGASTPPTTSRLPARSPHLPLQKATPASSSSPLPRATRFGFAR